MKWVIAWVLCAAWLGVARAEASVTATEQPAPSEVSQRAERLFQQAAQLIEQRRFALAAQQLERSQRLEPALGTLLSLALCYEHLSRPLDAWRAYEQVLSYEPPERAEQAALEGVARTLSRLPRVRLLLTGEWPAEARLRHNGEAVPSSYLERPLAVSAGEHQFEIQLRDETLWSVTLELDERAVERRVRVGPLTLHDDSSGAPWSGYRYAALASAGVALGGAVLGTAFLLRSIAKRDAADAHCSGRACRTREGVELREQALTAGTVATVGYAAAAVGAAAAGVLWLGFPATGGAEPGDAALRLGFGVGSVRLSGRF